MDTLKRIYQQEFNIDNIEALKAFNININTLKFNLTSHAITRLKERFKDITELFYFLKDLKLNYKDIIEVYYIGDYIEKAVYKVNFNNKDLILVLTRFKNICSIYIKGE
jgi:hypothetical protein